MSKMFNRARMSVTSTGTGTLTLGGAVLGYQSFATAGVANGDTVSYTIEDGANFEFGTGTYTSVGTTLSRTVTQSYNGTTYGTSPISVTTSAQVFITALAADLTSAANITSGTLDVANGGTGVTTSTGSGSVVLSTSPTLVTPVLGTPTSATLTNATGLPLTTGVTGTLPLANGGTGKTTAPAAYGALVGYASTATAGGTTTLTSASAYNQFFTGTTTQTVVMPDVTTLALGWTYHISNNSTGTLTVNSSGGNLISTCLAGTSLQLVCISITGTTAASWDYELIGFTTPTGSGNVVLATSPTLVTPVLGTPSSGTLTSCTGLPLTTGVTGTLPVANGGTGVTTSTGSGNVVLSTSPTLVTPVLGTPASGTLTNCTGLPVSGLASVTATATELNYTSGVTSAIQTQLNAKASTGKAIAMAIVFGG